MTATEHAGSAAGVLRTLAAEGRLVVRYRPSPEPQRLSVDVALRGPDRERYLVRQLAHCAEEIAAGGAGGADFAPEVGAAELVIPPDAEGSTYHFEMSVCGVAGPYLRHVCTLLARAPGIAALRVVGDRDPTGDGIVTERDVLDFVGPPATHLGRHAAPFPVRMVEREGGGDAFVRAVLEGGTSRDALLAFETTMLIWAGQLVTFAGPLGEEEVVLQLAPVAGRGERTLSTRYHRFRVERPPAVDLLVNYLSRYHGSVAPLERLDIGIAE